MRKLKADRMDLEQFHKALQLNHELSTWILQRSQMALQLIFSLPQSTQLSHQCRVLFTCCPWSYASRLKFLLTSASRERGWEPYHFQPTQCSMSGSEKRGHTTRLVNTLTWMWMWKEAVIAYIRVLVILASAWRDQGKPWNTCQGNQCPARLSEPEKFWMQIRSVTTWASLLSHKSLQMKHRVISVVRCIPKWTVVDMCFIHVLCNTASLTIGGVHLLQL